ncbi:mechanosensitive ion channel domain-containing protein [Halofilum ochraceum]|uniref:mechanosensitive ion channel domain-containing protein n=1 Tax=Halofilum ochraceum TaxID=1611323 RepID=UPI000830F7C7|nr:mechanosensitive ion channel domain-containing protein [Halofilum ochraceum]
MSVIRTCLQPIARLWVPVAFLVLMALPTLGAAQVLQAQQQSTDEAAAEPEKPSAAALADLLEDETSRQRLIEDLRRVAAEHEGAPETATTAPSLPERIAAASQAMASQVVGQFQQALAALQSIGSGPAIDWAAVGQDAWDLGLLILGTAAAFLLLRLFARRLFARVGGWAANGQGAAALLRRFWGVLLAVLIDAGVIALGWLAGWAIALFALGESGVADTRLLLFLNAFVLIEGIKLLIRVVFAARYDGLRLLPISGEEAAYWNAWLAHLTSFVGYGALVAVPLVRTVLSPALAQILYVLVVAIGFVYGLSIVLQNRARVRRLLEGWSQHAALGSTRVAAAVLARIWHFPAIAYLLALHAVLLLRPEEALPFMARATLQSLVAIGFGILLSAVIGRAISRGIRIPAASREKFPLLEARLNAFVPRGLQAIRFAIVVLVVALVLDGWQVFDLGAWLASDAGLAAVTALASILGILVVAVVAWIAIASAVDYWLSPETGTGLPSARQRTLLALFRNAAAVVIVTMAGMILLTELGINIGPLLAGAGVLGLAIGFGAQKLVQDIIGGVFIQLENAINTGDWIDAGGISGTAERLSIRSVGIRDLSGTFHIVPFSSVDTVSNYMRDFAYHVGVYGVAYRENTDEVIKHLIAAFEDLREDPEMSPEILDDLEISGVTAFDTSSVNIRIRIKTTPGNQWRMGRAYNRLVKQHFDAAGIEIPFPHTTVYFGHDKDGSAPAANLRLLDQRAEDGSATDGDGAERDDG